MSPRTAGTRSGRRTDRPLRDQGESAFTAILRALVARVPGARAAALVDFQGETVDYSGHAIPFDVRVAAAHWRIVLDVAEGQPSLPGLKWIVARTARRSYLAYALPERYALVILLARAAGFTGWQRAAGDCARALGKEAAWRAAADSSAQWFFLDVVSDDRNRPSSVRLAGTLRPVEILGTIVRQKRGATWAAPGDYSSREQGWRVRFETGAEATLVREPGGTWYADAALDGIGSNRPSRKSR